MAQKSDLFPQTDRIELWLLVITQPLSLFSFFSLFSFVYFARSLSLSISLQRDGLYK
jgi:hypothetical protein